MKKTKVTLSILLCLIMVISMGVPMVMPREVKAEDSNVAVTSYITDDGDSSNDNYFELEKGQNPDGTYDIPTWTPGQPIPDTTVFCISADRKNDNTVEKVVDTVMTIKNAGSTSYSGLTAEFDSKPAADDISLRLSSTTLNSGKEVKIYINFNQNQLASITAGNVPGNIVLKDNNGTVIKTIKFKYITPGCELKSTGRGTSNQIYKPADQTISIQNQTGESWTGLSPYLTEDKNTADGLNPNDYISMKLDKTTVGNNEYVKVVYNFKQTSIPPHLSQGIKLQLKDASGNVKYTCDFQYETPGYRMEFHADPLYYPGLWNGSYITLRSGNYSYKTKLVGTYDIVKTRPSIQVTYKASTLVQPGNNVGTKRFILPSNGNYYFYRTYNKKTKKYTYYYSINVKNQKNGQSNTVTIHMKETPRKALKSEMTYYKAVNAYDFFYDLSIEYTDGTIEGGGAAPLYLAVKYTRKPVGRTTVKVKYRKKKSVKISWSKFAGASGYKIYRSTKKNSGYKKIATVSSKKTSYVSTKLKRKKKYYYKVLVYRKINGKKYHSWYSYPVKAKTK